MMVVMTRPHGHHNEDGGELTGPRFSAGRDARQKWGEGPRRAHLGNEVPPVGRLVFYPGAQSRHTAARCLARSWELGACVAVGGLRVFSIFVAWLGLGMTVGAFLSMER